MALFTVSSYLPHVVFKSLFQMLSNHAVIPTEGERDTPRVGRGKDLYKDSLLPDCAMESLLLVKIGCHLKSIIRTTISTCVFGLSWPITLDIQTLWSGWIEKMQYCTGGVGGTFS